MSVRVRVGVKVRVGVRASVVMVQGWAECGGGVLGVDMDHLRGLMVMTDNRGRVSARLRVRVSA